MTKNLGMVCCLLYIPASCSYRGSADPARGVSAGKHTVDWSRINRQQARISGIIDGLETSGMALFDLEQSHTVGTTAMNTLPKTKARHLSTVASLRTGFLNEYIRRLRTLQNEDRQWVEKEVQDRLLKARKTDKIKREVLGAILRHFKLDSLGLLGSNAALLQDFDSMHLKLH